jgi:hypothetical protein
MTENPQLKDKKKKLLCIMQYRGFHINSIVNEINTQM